MKVMIHGEEYDVVRPGVYSRNDNGIELRVWSTGDIIAARRKELRLSQEQLADATGLNRSSISRYESGKAKKIPYEVLKEIAKQLYCTTDYLTAFTDDPNESLDHGYDDQTLRAMAYYARLSPEQRNAIDLTMKSMLKEE